MEYKLELKNVSKKFGKFYALKNLNMKVPKGKIYGLIGNNGAGKSTIMKLLNGNIYPDEGEILISEKSSQADLERERTKMGSIVDAPNLIESMTALENLEYMKRLKGLDNVVDTKAILKSVNLENTGKKKA
ncbi:MAG: ATP-binding cassette domain-containing protein, partial [Tissierellia bacterium]|nr:ATP-binding cassette domain-containing protein [Tissierellia bacterium]